MWGGGGPSAVASNGEGKKTKKKKRRGGGGGGCRCNIVNFTGSSFFFFFGNAKVRNMATFILMVKTSHLFNGYILDFNLFLFKFSRMHMHFVEYSRRV